jgi:hypothetical protein
MPVAEYTFRCHNQFMAKIISRRCAMFSFFKKKSKVTPNPLPVVSVLRSDANKLTQDIEKWLPNGSTPALLMAYVSPYVDFKQTCQALKKHLENVAPQCQLLATTTAGELSTPPDPTTSLYCNTENQWNSIVLQSFDKHLLKQIKIVSVPLNNNDLKRGEINISHHDRVQRIAQSLSRLSIPFPIDHHDTVALTLLDGLSASESFFSEAVYCSRRFPCHFIGGSAGSKSDFKNTYIFDGQQVREGHAVIAFIKIAPDYRYAIFSSHNFEKQNVSFLITDASQEQRWIKSVLTDDNHIIPFIDALKNHFKISSDKELEQKMADYSFAIEIEDRLFILSIANFDFVANRVSFFRDISIGEQLYLVKRLDLVSCTELDFKQFMALKNNATAVGGILNDCVLRRQHNHDSLSKIRCFDSIPIGGFSTFGEMYGINVNQTLTSLFFFHLEENDDYFYDESVDLFPILYAQFQNYGLQRQLKQMDILSKIRKEVILKQENYRTQMPSLTTQLTDIECGIKKISHQLQSLEKSPITEEIHMLDKTNYQALNSAIESARISAERVNEEIKILEQFTRMLN